MNNNSKDITKSVRKLGTTIVRLQILRKPHGKIQAVSFYWPIANCKMFGMKHGRHDV